MKTAIVYIPDKEENIFISLMKKFSFKTHVLTEEERKDMAMAKWIDEGMDTEDVPKEKVYKYLRKHGVNC